MHQRRTAMLVSLGALASVLLVLVVSSLVGSRHHRVAMPPADATPVEVVRTYVDAVNAQDRHTADALVEPSGRAEEREHVRLSGGRLDHVHVTDLGAESDITMGCGAAGEEIWMVGADQPSYDDLSSYLLTRDSPSSPWRICAWMGGP